jgi:hypothetical protein
MRKCSAMHPHLILILLQGRNCAGARGGGVSLGGWVKHLKVCDLRRASFYGSITDGLVSERACAKLKRWWQWWNLD